MACLPQYVRACSLHAQWVGSRVEVRSLGCYSKYFYLISHFHGPRTSTLESAPVSLLQDFLSTFLSLWKWAVNTRSGSRVGSFMLLNILTGSNSWKNPSPGIQKQPTPLHCLDNGTTCNTVIQRVFKTSSNNTGTIKNIHVQTDSNWGGNLEGEKNLSLPHWKHRKNDLEHSPEPF